MLLPQIVILGLPEMMVKLHADLVQMIWVVMAYILVSTSIALALAVAASNLPRDVMMQLCVGTT